MILRFVFAALACVLLHSAALAAEPIFPPGSRIGIVPPPGMTISEAFQGFEDRANGALLMLSEFSVQSYAKIEKDFGDEQMRAGGMTLVSRETIETPGGPASLIVARQIENDVAKRKWALLARTDDMTAVVIASIPEAAAAQYPDATLRATLASTFIRIKLSADEMLGVLPYRLSGLGGFRLMRATPDGTAVLTFGPKDTPYPVEQPYFTIALRAAEAPKPADSDRFAQRALMTFVNRPDLNIVRSEQIRLGGAPGHEIIAEGKDDRTGDPLMMVQWLRFSPGVVVAMFGIARKDRWDDALARMRTLRDGFERK